VAREIDKRAQICTDYHSCSQNPSGVDRHVAVGTPDMDVRSQIICDTFPRLVSNLYEMRMHIAVSRATSLLRVVGVEKEMRKDHRLAELI
jgi:hypothetical protein